MSQYSGPSETDVEEEETSVPSSQTTVSSKTSAAKKEAQIQPDRFVPDRENYEVFMNRSCILQRVDADVNKNKFYVLQLLRNKENDAYNLYFRWGKIEHHGRYRISKEFESPIEAVRAFEKKFHEKTNILWKERYELENTTVRYRFIDDEGLKEKIESGEAVITRRTSVDSSAEAERASQMNPTKKDKLRMKKELQAHMKEESRQEDDNAPTEALQKRKLRGPFINLLRDICFEINVLNETDFTTKKPIDKMSEDIYNHYPKIFSDEKGKLLNDNNKLIEAFKKIAEQSEKIKAEP